MNVIKRYVLVFASGLLLFAGTLTASVGDPQIKTDHPWYPGELSCSTFPRLFQTQSAQYQRETGRSTTTDEDKALASWYWHCTHDFHCEEAKEDYWDTGYSSGEEVADYWSFLFGYGFGMCYAFHAQYCSEMEQLLGHCRGRKITVKDHSSFEVFLTGGAYGSGDWALLDNIPANTVVFDNPASPTKLRSIWNIAYSDRKAHV